MNRPRQFTHYIITLSVSNTPDPVSRLEVTQEDGPGTGFSKLKEFYLGIRSSNV